MRRVRMMQTFLKFKKGEIYVVDVSKPQTGGYVSILTNGRSYKVPAGRVEPVGTTSPGAIPPTGSGGQTLGDLLGDFEVPVTGEVPDVPAPEPEPKPEPVILPDLPAGQMYLTEFTGGALPKSNVNHVITIFPKETWAEEERFFIPEFNEEYYWMPDLLEAVILGDHNEERVLLSGMPGTGKTTAHEQYAAIIEQPFFAINGKDGMEPSSFLGSLGPDGKGGWCWKDGTLPMCMKAGFSLCIDEVFKIPAGIQMAMQSMYQRKGRLVLDDKPGTLADKLVLPHDYFKLNVTDNVKGTGDNFGMFGATQLQDSSSLDRFGLTFTVPHLPEEVEVEILVKKFPDLKGTDVIRLVQVAALIRKSFAEEDVALTYSLRGMNACCRAMMKGVPIEQAFRLSYLEKLAVESEIETVVEFVKTSNLYHVE